jgi:hypothetical protein
MDCSIQLYSESYDVKSCNVTDATDNNALLFLKQTVRNSFIPNLLHKNGNYSEPTKELLQYLNFDFRLQPSLLHAVTNLHKGALVVDKEVIFIKVVEGYSRGKAMDIHAETNLKSVSTPSNSFYGSLSVGILEEADGGGSKRKLKIGSKTMNVSVTMSAKLLAEHPLNIGPETATTAWQIHPLTARIFYRVTEIKQFLEIMRSPAAYTMPTSLTTLRQLVSGFGDSTTFLPLRRAHEELDGDLMVPTTVFILCDTPHSQGYGTSANSTGKLASRFLQSLAMSMMTLLPTPDFSTDLHAFRMAAVLKNIQTNEKGKYKPSKSWDTLSSLSASLSINWNSMEVSLLL